MRGAALGLAGGAIILVGVFAVTVKCLSFHISSPARPWPWYCSDPAYSIIGYLAFPVNLLTNDLSQAVMSAPLSLLIYAIFGALMYSVLARLRLASP